jgi:hypothetical protein
MLNVASGVSGASPIWRRVLMEALAGKANVGFEAPKGIVTASVDAVSGYRAHDGFAERPEIFAKGTEPGEDTIHVKLKICRSDGNLATPFDINQGNYDEKEYFVFKEEDPTAGAGKPNKWQEGILAWLSTQTEPKYHPPSAFCGSSNPISIKFISPTDQTSNLPNEFEIRFSAESTVSIVNVDLEIDGTHIRSFDGPPFSHQVSGLANGTHQIRVRVKDANSKESDSMIRIGVGVEWNLTPTPSP